MYTTFLALHAVLRWLVLLSLLSAIIINAQGYLLKRSYMRIDYFSRVIAGAISHAQLLVGFTLYFVLSPITQNFLRHGAGGNYQLFFGIYHIAMMFLAVVVITIGGSVAKRADADRTKFKSAVVYFTIALCLILFAIPWFRPYLRSF